MADKADNHIDSDDSDDIGQCDCGATYDIGSRVDHNADTGQCWDCSDIHIDQMTDDEYDTYIEGN